jgi:hypothetical protein
LQLFKAKVRFFEILPGKNRFSPLNNYFPLEKKEERARVRAATFTLIGLRFVAREPTILVAFLLHLARANAVNDPHGGAAAALFSAQETIEAIKHFIGFSAVQIEGRIALFLRHWSFPH